MTGATVLAQPSERVPIRMLDAVYRRYLEAAGRAGTIPWGAAVWCIVRHTMDCWSREDRACNCDPEVSVGLRDERVLRLRADGREYRPEEDRAPIASWGAS